MQSHLSFVILEVASRILEVSRQTQKSTAALQNIKAIKSQVIQ